MTAYVARLVERDQAETAIETINLTGGPVFLNGWSPESPENTLNEFIDATRDGGETVENTLQNVVEGIPVTILDGTYGGTPYLAHTVIDSINAMLARGTAYAKARRTDRRVWLEVQRESSTALYRSQVIAFGPVKLTGDSFGLDWAASGAQALITLGRRYYVEGTQAELPLNTATGGVTIYNHDDAGTGHNNYVDIAAANVAGGLPAPIKLSVGFNVNDHSILYVGQTLVSPGSEVHVLEAEDNYGYTTGDTVDADCSGGYYANVAYAGAGSETLKWYLATAFLSYARGRWFRLVGRFQTAPGAGVTITPYLTLVGVATVAKTFQATTTPASYTLIDLGAIQIPPWLPGDSALAGSITLGLTVARTSAGNVKLDYVGLIPLDGYALYMGGYRASSKLIDHAGACYFEDATALRSGGVQRFGPGVWVWPNNVTRLFFHGQDTSYASAIAQTFTVQAWYRPRRAAF